MKKVLVTGGAGFIGSNLCEYLIHKGFKVVCLDNFSTGHIRNIQHLIQNHPDMFTLIKGDIRDLNTCVIATTGVDVILHEAALGSIPRSIDDPITTNDVNIGGFLNMLVAARDCKVKRFIFAASSSTYGDNTDLPKVEDNIGKPLSPYALTKYVDELYAEVFSKTYGLEYIGLRYFNVFGRRQDANSAYAAVIPLFIKQLMQHESPVINGDGTHSRDFTYIDNVLHMNLLAIKTRNPDAVNQIYNTACGDSITISRLVELLKEILSIIDPSVANVEVKKGPMRCGDIPHSLASIKKAHSLLGYSPVVDVFEGLKDSAMWYFRELNERK